MELSIVIEQKDLVNYLHESIITLYQKGAVRFVNSCLTEVLEVAFNRFAELGICTAQVYNYQTDNQVIYLQCKPSKGKVLKEYIKILSAMATCG
jgi:hypothetical protein